jgi:hypothetical protein
LVVFRSSICILTRLNILSIFLPRGGITSPWRYRMFVPSPWHSLFIFASSAQRACNASASNPACWS